MLFSSVNLNYKSKVRLFKSDFWEQFTHVHPAGPLFFWIPVILYFFYRIVSSQNTSLVEFFVYGFVGLMAWSFVEYLLHRFVFHYQARTKIGKRFVYIMHGLHHDDPIDPTRLVMPILPGIIYAVVFYAGLKFVFASQIDTVFAFFMIGYLAYDYTHFYVHHYKPSHAWGKFMKKHHMDHHFVHHDKFFGVSNPLWDYVFGTLSKDNTQAHSNQKITPTSEDQKQ